MPNKVVFLVVLILWTNFSQNEVSYYKDYYGSGQLKSEGWLKNGVKTKYWKFYHANGKIASQGHYKNDIREKYWYFYSPNGRLVSEGNFVAGKKAKWWLFYNGNGDVNHKCQLRNGIKNGYCLKYENTELVSAEKYKRGKKIKEWSSFADFKRENNLSDLK